MTESEPIVTRIADATQQVQQQSCPRGESQIGNSSDKPSGEESTNEPNKTGNLPNGDESQKSQGWKRFSLKRQLSKVDLKIKNTFTPSLSSQNGVLVCYFNTCFDYNLVSNFNFCTAFPLLLNYIFIHKSATYVTFKLF